MSLELPKGSNSFDRAPDCYSDNDKKISSDSNSACGEEGNSCDSAYGGKIVFLSQADRIAQLDKERAEHVDKRRHSSNPVDRFFNKIIPYGGILSSGFNLVSSCIGAGIISLPSAFNTSGLGMAIIYLVIVGLLSVYGFTCLAYAGKRTGLRNYEQIARTLLGPGADYFLAFCLWFMSFGSNITYVISTQDIISTFIEHSDSAPDYLRTLSGRRLLTAMVWLVFMLPLSLPKEINSLRYFSFIAIIFIIYFVVCMIVHSGIKIHARGGVPEDIVYFQSGNQAIEGLGIFMFAYICHMNMFEVYEEMYKPGVKRYTLASGMIAVLATALYFCSGLFGYLDFGGAIKGSVLLYYNPIEDKEMAVAYCGIVLKMCVAYGLHMIPVRDATYHVLKIDVKEIAWWKNAVIMTTWALISLIAGMFIPRVNLVFGVVGSFAGGFIGFVYPALMFMYCGNFTPSKVGWYHYLLTYIMLIVGVIGVVFGTIASIYSEVMSE